MIVTLTADQVEAARRVGRRRNATHRSATRASRSVMGGGNTSLSIDEDGATAELAVAVALGREWTGRLFEDLDDWSDYAGQDVDGVEVRSTRRANGSLILHARDPDVPFVLAIRIDADRFRLAGWIGAGEGKRAAFWRDYGNGRPAYFVPIEELRPVSELVQHLNKGGSHADALKTPADPGDGPGRGGTEARGSVPGRDAPTQDRGGSPDDERGRPGYELGSPALPDSCDWCGWLAPTLRLVEVSWTKIVNIYSDTELTRAEGSKGVVVASRDVKRVESWWLCALCSQRIPRRNPDLVTPT